MAWEKKIKNLTSSASHNGIKLHCVTVCITDLDRSERAVLRRVFNGHENIRRTLLDQAKDPSITHYQMPLGDRKGTRYPHPIDTLLDLAFRDRLLLKLEVIYSHHNLGWTFQPEICPTPF